jgi:hypothetical protein
MANEKQLTQADLNILEKHIDIAFARVGIDVEFTRHFLDRVNDERNRKQITLKELALLFKKELMKWGKPIAQLDPNSEAVMKDLETDINIPFVLKLDRNGDLDLVAKTVMRKKNFRTPDKEFPVESNDMKHSKFLESLIAMDDNEYLISESTIITLCKDVLNNNQESISKLLGLVTVLETEMSNPKTKALFESKNARIEKITGLLEFISAAAELISESIYTRENGYYDNAEEAVAAAKEYLTGRKDSLDSVAVMSNGEYYTNIDTRNANGIDSQKSRGFYVIAYVEKFGSKVRTIKSYNHLAEGKTKEDSTNLDINYIPQEDDCGCDDEMTVTTRMPKTGRQVNEDKDSMTTMMNAVKEKINAPVIKVGVSTLGGNERASGTIHLSLDEKEDWQNNIFQNSRYGIFMIWHDGKMELSSKSHELPVKFRKSKYKTADDIAAKINKWIDANSLSEGLKTGRQVKGSEARPTNSKDSGKGFNKHPYRGRLVASEFDENFVKNIKEELKTKLDLQKYQLKRMRAAVIAKMETIAKNDASFKTYPAHKTARIFKHAIGEAAFEIAKMFDLTPLGIKTGKDLEKYYWNEKNGSLAEFKIWTPDENDTLGIERIDMPQIKSKHMKTFVDEMADEGIGHHNMNIDPHDLKPSQKEFSKQGVEKSMGKMKQRGDDMKPLFISEDMYIVDGHHRWLAAVNAGKKTIPVVMIEAPFEVVHQKMMDFDHSHTKDVYTEGKITENPSKEEDVVVSKFAKMARNDDWSVYVSRMAHRSEKDYRLEFEKNDNEFDIIGKGDLWELYRSGPTLSGRGEEFTTLEDAFNAATNVSEDTTLMKGASKDARNRDIEQSDNEYSMQKMLKKEWKQRNPGKKWPGYHAAKAEKAKK